MNNKLRILGKIVTTVALLFLCRKLWKMDVNWHSIANGRFLWIAFISTSLYIVSMFICTIPWMKLVEVFCGEKDRLEKQKGIFAYVFLKSNILKYIPGNILQFVGRNEIAVRMKLRHANVVMASITEILINTVIALSISAITILPYTVNYFITHLLLMARFSAFFGVLLIAFLYFFTRKGNSIQEYVSQFINFFSSPDAKRNFLYAFLLYFISFFVNTVIFTFLLKYNTNMVYTSNTLRFIIGAYILSWLAGYITPGAPGGIGVREIIMISILVGSGIVEEKDIVQTSVLFRLITIIGDLIAFLAIFLYRRATTNRVNASGEE